MPRGVYPRRNKLNKSQLDARFVSSKSLGQQRRQALARAARGDAPKPGDEQWVKGPTNDGENKWMKVNGTNHLESAGTRIKTASINIQDNIDKLVEVAATTLESLNKDIVSIINKFK